MNRAMSLTAAIAVLAIALVPAQAAETTRVTVNAAGTQGNGYSYLPGVSASHAQAQYIVFESNASNLVANDTNGQWDVFLYDRMALPTPQIVRVSISSAGAEADNGSYHACVSADGRYVAFYSHATNLVAVDTNAKGDIFVRDRTAGTTTRVSVSSAGVQANGDSYDPSISADGRYVAFESYASNLVAGDTNARYDIFVHDRNTAATTRVSVSSGGAEGNDASHSSSINYGGDIVAFESYATNLVASDTNGASDIFLRNRTAGTTTRISVSSGGTQADLDSYGAAMSPLARYVAFYSHATNLVANDTNNWSDIFVHDCSAGGTTRVSVSSTGQQATNYSTGPSISYDGQYVAFHSLANNLVPNDTNGVSDVFVHNRNTGQTRRFSVDSTGQQGNSASYEPSITDGSGTVYVAFHSDATNLVSGDTNAKTDIFLHTRGPGGADDFDADGDIDLDDFTIFEDAMDGPGQTPGQPEADLDGDGDCDVDDFTIFADDFTGSL